MQFDLHTLLRIARRWWVLLLLAPIIGGATAYTFSNRQPEMYSAEATLLINPGMNSGATSETIRTGQNLIETFSTWIVSRPVLERVSDNLGYEGGVDELQHYVSAASVADTLFINIAAVDNDPETAALIANTLADEFVLYVAEQADSENQQLKSGINLQIDEISLEIADIDASIATLEASGDSLSQADQNQLASLTDRRARLDQELTQLQTIASEFDVQLASSSTRITVSAPAIAPDSPFAPRVVQAVMIGIVAGLALAMAGAILLEYLDNTVRTREDIDRITGAPLLATIANAPEIQRDGRQLFVLGSPMSGPSEAMRLLRTNLAFACAPGDMSTIAVSSAGPEAGKSTLVGNLAVVMSQAGLRTVVIDADLRRPSQHEIFGLHNDYGLTTLLTEPGLDWRDVAIPLSIHGTWVIPSGPLPPNPADLLGLPRFSQVLANIRESVDVVLIDTAPALAVSDALIVAKKTDGAVLVCRPGHTRRDALTRATAAFAQGNIKLLGFVMNRVKSEADEYDGYEQVTAATEMPSARFYYGESRSRLPVPRSIFSAAKPSNGKNEPAHRHVANKR